jgi:hypothetical protein
MAVDPEKILEQTGKVDHLAVCFRHDQQDCIAYNYSLFQS